MCAHFMGRNQGRDIGEACIFNAEEVPRGPAQEGTENEVLKPLK